MAASVPAASLVHAKLSKGPGKVGVIFFLLAWAVGLAYIGLQLSSDLSVVHSPSVYPFLLLGAALLVALGFEFVNGFHDTANAVATVIYTHSLDPHIAVVWSGICNFTGVVISTGVVAFSIITLLPVELILQVGRGAGFAMVFALLMAAILWNLGTWYFGLPSSSTHTMVGSIIGVGIANQILSVKTGTSGVDWAQAANVGRTLLISPIVGFVCAALLLMIAKLVIPDKRLYEAPKGEEPPPFWIRCLLILTCTGVSYSHGSNDGQKGMGLIMLILIGTVPTAYALNHAIPDNQVQTFIAVSDEANATLSKHVSPDAVIGDPAEEVTAYVRTRQFNDGAMLALREMVDGVSNELNYWKSLAKVPADRVSNLRNDMYVISEALRLMKKSNAGGLTDSDWAVLDNYKKQIDAATKFIPLWVKVAVALALGLGTMIGWKRIVITVGEKIGKDHLTYGQGAAAEITAMATISAADMFGLPVSTTHVLSSGVAGTMAANRSGLQWGTMRNLALAWVLTLPASIIIASLLYWGFRRIGG
jgi:inorganic phosphate transporter, PiT family